MCIRDRDIATANKLAAQMAIFQEPQTYLPRADALSKSDALFALTRPLPPSPPPGTNVLDCKSRGGMAFKVLAKNRQWGKDFWNGFVGPALAATRAQATGKTVSLQDTTL